MEREDKHKEGNRMMYRQGDVLVMRAKEIPKSAKQQTRCVLALGEATGHAHQIKEGATMYLDSDGTKFFHVEAPPHSGGLPATLLEEDDQSILVLSGLGTIRFSKAFARYANGIVHCESFALLEHEEHSFQAYGKGIYRHIQQREYTPEEIRNVAD